MKKTQAAIPLLQLVLVLSSVPVVAQQSSSALFSRPLHLVREIDDPISGNTYVVEEFYSGNRAVLVNGDRVAIADYEEGTLMEIDRAARTYSVESFEVIAQAKRSLGGPSPPIAGADATVDRINIAPQQVAGQVAESIAAEFEDGELRRVEISLSSEIHLTRDALEVVLGAAYPNEPRRESVVVAELARRPDKARASVEGAPRLALPLSQIFVYEIDGELLTLAQRTVSVDEASVDPALLALPPGAVRVESHLVKMDRLLEELDQLPGKREASQP